MHTQSREALNHLAYTIAAGGSGPRVFRDGAVKQPSKMPGRPNSRGRLSLNLLTDPERSTKNKGKPISREKQARGSPRLKKKRKRKKKER